MEKISIEIPASLFTEIYKRYGPKTAEIINQTLISLIDVPPADLHGFSARPKPHTITGRIWEIADDLKTKQGFANRNEVVAACIAEGINVNTANTQFSHWLKENA